MKKSIGLTTIGIVATILGAFLWLNESYKGTCIAFNSSEFNNCAIVHQTNDILVKIYLFIAIFLGPILFLLGVIDIIKALKKKRKQPTPQILTQK